MHHHLVVMQGERERALFVTAPFGYQWTGQRCHCFALHAAACLSLCLCGRDASRAREDEEEGEEEEM